MGNNQLKKKKFKATYDFDEFRTFNSRSSRLSIMINTDKKFFQQ